MSSPKLSLCLPTFQRAKQLSATLENLKSEVAKLPARYRDLGLELCVSDNGSEDNTPAVVLAFQKSVEFPVQYARFASNMKIDRNIAQAADLATGEFIWFLSDDDHFFEGALKKVFDIIVQDPSLCTLIVNRQEFDADIRNPHAPAKLLNTNADNSSLSALPLQNSLLVLGEYLGYLPAWVIKREAWKLAQAAPFFETDFVHVGVGLLGSQRYLRTKQLPEQIWILNQPLLKCRLARASWRNRHYEVWIRNWQKTMDLLKNDFEYQILRQSKTDVVQRNYLSILSGRGFGYFDINDFQIYIAPFLKRPWLTALAFFVAIMPRSMASGLTRLQREIRSSFAQLRQRSA